MSKKPKDEKKEQRDADDWKDKFLRALADYQNLEKRQEGENERIRNQAKKNLLLKFLDILDDIESAEIFVKDSGLKLIKNKFINILKSEGVSEMGLMGKTYDPHFAECVEVSTGEKDNIIVGILRKGYKLNDDILRVPRVKVEKKVIN